MQRGWSGVVCAAVVLGAVLAAAPEVSAQSIVDGRRAEFTPSADHNAVDQTTGAAIVQRYVLDVFQFGGSTPASTADLGKPAPDTDGMIRIDFVALLSIPLTPGVVYEAVVSAIGPGGTGASSRSNTFSFSTPCAPTISPTSQSVAAGGGSGSASVTVAAGCAWTASSNASWITVTGGASGSGPGTVSYSVAANAGTGTRSGTLTIAGATFTVTQAGVACAPAIAPTSANVGAAANSGNVTVTAATGCAWTASSNASWMTISAGASGAGDGNVTYDVAANTSATSRSGTLTIAGTTFTVTQAGGACAPTISPSSASAAGAGAAGTVSVSAAEGCGWTATSNAGWISVTAGAAGSGNGTVDYSVAPNGGTAIRTGTVTIGGNTLTITQAAAGCSYSLSATSANVGPTRSLYSVTVTAPTGCAWTSVSNDPWITIIAGSADSGFGTVTYRASANHDMTPRTGTMTIAGQTFTVTQAGEACTPTISPASASVAAAGTNATVSVSAPTGCPWSAAANASWLAVTAGATGSGNGSVAYSVAANTGAARTGTITIAGKTFTVTQSGVLCSYSISPTSAALAASGGTGTVAVSTPGGCTWTAVSNASWVTITSGGSGTGPGTVAYSAATNTSSASRTGTLTIAGRSFTITEPAANCTFTVSPLSVSATAAAMTGRITVTAQDGCTWSSSSSAPWVTVMGSGTGSGYATFTIQSNAGTAARTAVLYVAGVAVSVQQAAPTTQLTAPANLRIVVR